MTLSPEINAKRIFWNPTSYLEDDSPIEERRAFFRSPEGLEEIAKAALFKRDITRSFVNWNIPNAQALIKDISPKISNGNIAIALASIVRVLEEKKHFIEARYVLHEYFRSAVNFYFLCKNGDFRYQIIDLDMEPLERVVEMIGNLQYSCSRDISGKLVWAYQTFDDIAILKFFSPPHSLRREDIYRKNS
ncbi:hypothetical protein HZA98_03355 [Candidatus Woesearchaeota archaeon]|nr:hypothetical protein [Candidatus Woesearchaeota archaeon]